MCQYSVTAQNGVATNWHLMHYGALARGGAGLVTIEATAVTPEGRITPQDLGLWNDQQIAAFTPISALMHSEGAVVGIQLGHAGRKASTRRGFPGEQTGVASENEGGWQPVAPSPLAFPGLAEPTPLDHHDIDNVVDSFASAAKRAVEANIDVIEIHGAHGYLLHQFLSPLSNERSDEYGGTLQNRARLLLRVTDAVREAVGDVVPIIVRLSATEWLPNGCGVDDTVQVSKWLKDHGADLISVSSAGNTPSAPIPVGPGYQVPLAETIRREAKIPTGVAGLITEPAQAEQIVALGQADAVYVGREVLRDPNFPIRAARFLKSPHDHVPPQHYRAWL
jgi:NADH:flavin oxidoreductases, Old Yellow Enzyme family